VIHSSAAICIRPSLPLSVETIEVEGPREGEALVEIVASGLCHTDLTALEGTNATCVYPLIPGHEGAGRVVEIGAGVKGLKPGDHVIPLYGPECTYCRMCRSGRTNGP
jgi:S-(hydroxymethyl)glutathione dehydrogenase / alcohol dehydrogenase